MISFYDSNGKKTPLVNYENWSIKHNLNGCDTMTFYVDVRDPQYKQLFEECRVETADNEWLIKKIDDDKIDCELNFDFLKSKIYKNYKSETRSLSEVLIDHLPKDWTVSGASVSSIKRTITFDYCTDYDVIYECMHTYGIYLVWKIKEKNVTVYDPSKIPPSGEYLTDELNLKKLSFKGKSTDLATRLYAYGKDGMTMEEAVINGVRYGKEYVDGNEYAEKVVCAYWYDDRYTVPENLYNDSVKKLQTLSYPVRSYSCSVIDIARLDPAYSSLTIKMHRKLTLMDSERGIRVEHQVVEYTEYPDEPDRNKVVLSCVPDTIKSIVSGVKDTVKNEVGKMQTDFDSRLALSNALLLNAFGMYPYTDNNGKIYLLDNPDPAIAQKVILISSGGCGISSTGIEGPYTTTLTFDDTFITNVIQAMIIRGDLIEADSIKAKSISQSYTDDVLEQAFSASEGLVQSKFKQISEYLSNAQGDGQLDVMKEQLTQIQQTIDGMNLQFNSKFSGGINYVKNSAGLNGIDDNWELIAGIAETAANSDTKNNTVSNSYFRLKDNTTISQAIDKIIPGKSYSLSFKARKSSTLLATVKVIYNGDVTILPLNTSDRFDWKEFSCTIDNINSTSLKIEIYSRAHSLYISDIMLCEGTLPKAWTPAPNEIYTSGVKVNDKGVEVYREGTSEKTAITHHEFASYYQGEKVMSVNKDETYIKKTIIDGELTVGKVKIIPLAPDNPERGVNFTVLD